MPVFLPFRYSRVPYGYGSVGYGDTVIRGLIIRPRTVSNPRTLEIGKQRLDNVRPRSLKREKHMLNGKGRLGLATLACVGLAIAISHTPAAAWKRGAVQTFALPQDVPMVEGLTVGRNGNVYVSTFNPTGSGNSLLLTFNAEGKLLNRVTIQNSSSAMLGLAIRPGNPGADDVMAIDFGNSQVLDVNPDEWQFISMHYAPGHPRQEPRA